MRRALFAALFAALIAMPAPAMAQDHSDHRETATTAEPAEEPGNMDHGAMDHSSMDHGAMDHPIPDAPPPPDAGSGPARAADAVWGADAMRASRAALFHNNGGQKIGSVMLDRFEARLGTSDGYVWDGRFSYGGDLDKFVLRSEGEGEFGGKLERGEVQGLWSHAIDPWFNLQAGMRQELQPGGRTQAVLGVEGLTPYMLHVNAAAFLSTHGELTGRIEGEYDQKITQRLVLQPRGEVNLSAQDIAAQQLGSGVTRVEAGLRLRYEFAREFAPYVGYSYEWKLGGTRAMALANGEDPSKGALVIGLRAWF